MRISMIFTALAAAGCGSCGDDGGTAAPDGAPGGMGEMCIEQRPPSMGEATYYGATGAGNCSFDPSPNDLMVAAMNAPQYADAAWCGGCVAVSGPKGEVTVRIVDQCPGCQQGDLDLSEQAFVKIADKSAGRVPITWHEVACDVTGPIAYQHKSGTSQYYTAIQVRNHRYPISKLEAKDATGMYVPIPRLDYNYFVPKDALGAGPYDLRVTDSRGQVLDDSIPLAENQVKPGAAQFPVCP